MGNRLRFWQIDMRSICLLGSFEPRLSGYVPKEFLSNKMSYYPMLRNYLFKVTFATVIAISSIINKGHYLVFTYQFCGFLR